MIQKIKCFFGFHTILQARKILQRDLNHIEYVISEGLPYGECLYCKALYGLGDEE